MHNFDRCTVTLGIKQKLGFYSYLQVNIKAPSSTSKVIADYSYKGYIEVSAEDLSLKQGIGLEKAKATLDVTA